MWLSWLAVDKLSSYPALIPGSRVNTIDLMVYTNPIPMIVDEVKRLGQNQIAALYQLEDSCFKATQSLSSSGSDRKTCFATLTDGNRIIPFEYNRSHPTPEQQQLHRNFRKEWPSTRKDKPSAMAYPHAIPCTLIPIILKEDMDEESERRMDEVDRIYREDGMDPPPRLLPNILMNYRVRNAQMGYYTRIEGQSQGITDPYKLHLVYTSMNIREYPSEDPSEDPSEGVLYYREGMYFHTI